MLGWRLVISFVLVPLLLGLFWWDSQLGMGAPVLLIFCLLLTVRGAFEMSQLLRTRNTKPVFEVAAIANVALVLATWYSIQQIPDSVSPTDRLMLSLGSVMIIFLVVLLFLMLLEAIRYRLPGHSMESLGGNLLTVTYSGLLITLLAQFRWYPQPSVAYFVLGSVIIAVKSGDIMAYTFGRLWGKKKMVPILSPGKTWMGGLGAIVGSSLGTWLWLTFGGRLFDAAPTPAGLERILLYGAVLGVVGLIGDLCESLIKRDCEKKDSAELLPGFGGLLDLIDSPLYAGPVALLFWLAWPPAIIAS